MPTKKNKQKPRKEEIARGCRKVKNSRRKVTKHYT